MTGASIELDGVVELENDLSRFGIGSTSQSTRRVLQSGGDTLTAEIRRNTPRRRSGRLGRSVASQVIRTERGLAIVSGFNVGDRKGTAPHAGLVINGTKRRRTRNGANRGRVKGTDVIGRSIRRATPRVISSMTDTINRELET